eukprot:2416228-Pyramimonas_sp.AAC.1
MAGEPALSHVSSIGTSSMSQNWAPDAALASFKDRHAAPVVQSGALTTSRATSLDPKGNSP